MSELKPCPWCGGEAELATRKARNGNTHYKYRCSKCHASIGRWHGGISGHPWTALEAWNSRAERTCKFVSSKGSDYPPVCSACGYELGIYDCEWFEDGTYGYDGNYCPNCGRRVTA